MLTQDLQTIALFSELEIKAVFNVVLQFRMSTRVQIESKLDYLPKENISAALKKLENEALIKIASTPINDYDLFYPTAYGMDMMYLLRI